MKGNEWEEENKDEIDEREIGFWKKKDKWIEKILVMKELIGGSEGM